MDGVVERPLLDLLGGAGVAVVEGDVQLDRLIHVERQVGLVEVSPIGNLTLGVILVVEVRVAGPAEDDAVVDGAAVGGDDEDGRAGCQFNRTNYG